MDAQTAFETLDAEAWAATSAVERLAVIEAIQKNLLDHASELGRVDAAMKNDLAGDGAVSEAEGMASTVNAMGNTLMGIRHLYESLEKGSMPAPNSMRKIGDDLWEIDVYPIHRKDKLLAGKGRGLLHVSGEAETGKSAGQTRWCHRRFGCGQLQFVDRAGHGPVFGKQSGDPQTTWHE